MHNWANCAWNLTEALRSVGVHAELYTGETKNVFGYCFESCDKAFVGAADVIHVLDDAPGPTALDRLGISGDAPIIQTVNGTGFRREGLLPSVVGAAYRLDEYLHPRIVARSAVSPDLLIPGFGGELLPNAYPVEQSPVDWEYRRPPRLVHCPSNAKKKGTDRIEAGLRALNEPYRYVRTSRIAHDEVQRELDGATLYLDQIGIGWYGMSGIEAMARGIPVACFISSQYGARVPSVYKSLPMLNLGHTADSAKDAIRRFLRADKLEIEAWSNAARDYALETHGYTAVGQLAKRIYRRVA